MTYRYPTQNTLIIEDPCGMERRKEKEYYRPTYRGKLQ
jgi:hypothetical protein